MKWAMLWSYILNQPTAPLGRIEFLSNSQYSPNNWVRNYDYVAMINFNGYYLKSCPKVIFFLSLSLSLSLFLDEVQKPYSMIDKIHNQEKKNKH